MQFLSSFIPSESLIQWLKSSLPSIMSALIVMALALVLWKVISRILKVIFAKAKLDLTASSFILTIAKYTIFIIGVLSALSYLGINTISIMTSLGVLGLTIGFAAKDTLSNIISGIFIFWDRPFVIGDLVEIEGNYGRVDSITMRSTRVITPDGKMLAIPNTIIANSTVASYTNFPHLMLEVDFTIGVNEDINRVRKIALNVCREMEALLETPSPDLVVIALNDYNLGLRLSAWLDDEKQHVKVRALLREKLYNALRNEGVDMPYETLTLTPLHLKTTIPEDNIE